MKREWCLACRQHRSLRRRMCILCYQRRALPSCRPNRCYVRCLKACRDCVVVAMSMHLLVSQQEEFPQEVIKNILDYVEWIIAWRARAMTITRKNLTGQSAARLSEPGAMHSGSTQPWEYSTRGHDSLNCQVLGHRSGEVARAMKGMLIRESENVAKWLYLWRKKYSRHIIYNWYIIYI